MRIFLNNGLIWSFSYSNVFRSQLFQQRSAHCALSIMWLHINSEKLLWNKNKISMCYFRIYLDTMVVFPFQIRPLSIENIFLHCIGMISLQNQGMAKHLKFLFQDTPQAKKSAPLEPFTVWTFLDNIGFNSKCYLHLKKTTLLSLITTLVIVEFTFL